MEIGKIFSDINNTYTVKLPCYHNNPCQNNGECKIIADYECICMNGFSGVNCTVPSTFSQSPTTTSICTYSLDNCETDVATGTSTMSICKTLCDGYLIEAINAETKCIMSDTSRLIIANYKSPNCTGAPVSEIIVYKSKCC